MRIAELACAKWNAASYHERMRGGSYEIVQRYAQLAPEHLAEFAGNAKVAKSVAGKSGVVINIA
jgi:hypothetical protein